MHEAFRPRHRCLVLALVGRGLLLSPALELSLWETFGGSLPAIFLLFPSLPSGRPRCSLGRERVLERERARERESEPGRFSWAATAPSVRTDSPASSTLGDRSHVLETFIYSVFLQGPFLARAEPEGIVSREYLSAGIFGQGEAVGAGRVFSG